MKIAAIVTEFNPFHNGHSYLCRQIRAQGYQGIICVMSPHFVQRGEPALFSKWARAKAALEGGADLIVELPVPYALSSGHNFASAAISILASLQCIDSLFFGSESGDAGQLYSLWQQLQDTALKNKIHFYIKQGFSYPTALHFSIEDIFPGSAGQLTPNNILALEYISAVEALKRPFAVQTILRSGAGHDSFCASENFASASLLRQEAKKGVLPLRGFIPEQAFAIYKEEYRQGLYCLPNEEVQRMVLARLRTLSLRYWHSLADTQNGLAQRFYEKTRQAVSMEGLLFSVKTKSHSLAKIRRISYNAFLNLPAPYQFHTPPYIRILGFNQTGRGILGLANAVLPMDTSLKRLAEKNRWCQRFANAEARATDLWALLLQKPQPCGMEYTASPVLL